MPERKSKDPAAVAAASKKLAAGQSFVMDDDGTPFSNYTGKSFTEPERWIIHDENTGNHYRYNVDSGYLELELSLDINTKNILQLLSSDNLKYGK